MNSADVSHIPEMESDLANNNSLYANLKSTITTLKQTYDLDNCSVTNTCNKELKYSELSSSNYDSGVKILAVTTEKDEICNDPYKNKCATMLKDLENSQQEIKEDLIILKSTVEEFTNYESDGEYDDNIEDFRFSMELKKKLEHFQDNTEISNEIEKHTTNE